MTVPEASRVSGKQAERGLRLISEQPSLPYFLRMRSPEISDQPFELSVQGRGQPNRLLQLSHQFIPLAVKPQPEMTFSESCVALSWI